MYMSQAISIRQLREQLAVVLRKVSRGEQVIVTKRGKPVARIVPEKYKESPQASRHTLRGSVRRMSKDFDKPLGGLWEALRP